MPWKYACRQRMQGGWHLLGASHNRGHVSEWGVPSFTCQVRRCCTAAVHAGACNRACRGTDAVHAGAEKPCRMRGMTACRGTAAVFMQEQRSRAARLHALTHIPLRAEERHGGDVDLQASGRVAASSWSALPESHTFRGAQAGHDCRAWLPGVAAAHCHGAIGTYSCPIFIIVYAQANLLNLNPLNLGLSSPGGPRCRQEAPREGQAKAAAVGWASWRAAAAAGEEPAGLQGAAGSLPLSRSAAGWKAPGRLHRFGRSCPLL